jgi:segregation and condensation protein B
MAEGMAAERLQAILESLLCAQAEPLTVEKVMEAVSGVTRLQVTRAFAVLGEQYEREGRGFRIAAVAGGYQLRTAPEHQEYVRRLLRERPMRLTRAMLETLAIVAYKQVVTRAEVEAIRGVDVDSALSTLLEKRLIRIAGRKEAPGRPLLYATSREFLEVFGLRDLSELPTLKELETVDVESAPEIDLRESGGGESAGGEASGVDRVSLVPPARAEREELARRADGADMPGGAEGARPGGSDAREPTV